MSKQVLDRNQMEHLCELGIDTTQATMCWIKRYDDDRTSKDILCMHDEFCYEFSCLDPEPTFTLQDILDLLPNEIYTEENELATLKIHFPNDGYWEFSYMGIHKCIEFFLEENAIDAAYEMLCWCIENEYVRTESN